MNRLLNLRLGAAWALPGTMFALGPGDILRKAWHVAGIRCRIHPAVRSRALDVRGPLFRAKTGRSTKVPHSAWRDEWWAYGQPVNGSGRGIPDWNGPLGSTAGCHPRGEWWCSSANYDQHDIKDVWEFSRFDWMLCMAQRVANGDPTEAERLRTWSLDWVASNPPFKGDNWRCGQEASIRVIHLAIAALILGEDHQPEPSLLDLVEVHLRRILPTVGYALSQRNNHGSSEAAALFVGGCWLSRQGRAAGKQYESAGRRLLRRAVLRCTCVDGTLSQYSATYQRLFLDALSVAALWGCRLGLQPFDAETRERIQASIEWMDSMIDPETGDAPNIGGNDGAMLLPVGPTHYRNFRPSLHLAGALFGSTVSNRLDLASRALLDWLEVRGGPPVQEPRDRAFLQGGFVAARSRSTLTVLRLPTFAFRPAHADALHVDLWVRGRNLIRDSGSYRYHQDPISEEWFPSTAAHSTIEFDGRSQMPRLSRFLFGAWLRARDPTFRTEPGGVGEAAAGYRDAWGATHRRHVRWSPGRLRVVDSVSDFRKVARLRWHLAPMDWKAGEGHLSAGDISLSVLMNGQRVQPLLIESRRSLHYGRCDTTPALEVKAHEPSTIITDIEWKT